ncbi:MAG: ribonuclease HI [Treponema sp.]|jgi:ribonuclease HI|nr:ribonuclease HI [Treponema sp.]
MMIFTDGGCSGNPGPGGWAYVIVDAKAFVISLKLEDALGYIIEENCGAEANTTNNRMELQAVINALEAVKAMNKDRVPLEVFTDSQYVQKGMSQWILDWKNRGWRTSGKDPVKNQDLWQHLDALASGFSITWRWVKGHAGNVFNERCDSLTQRAINSLK